MRLPPNRERDLRLAILKDDSQCVVFPQHLYRRADGFLPIHRDGMQELLHRRLFRLLRDKDLGVRKLERTCPTWGCVNPFHFALVAGLVAGTRRACPNGHLYADVGRTPDGHCRVCAEARRTRRSNGRPTMASINRAKRFCAHGHEYTEANTYRQRLPHGYRRKCRACNLAAVQRRRGNAS